MYIKTITHINYNGVTTHAVKKEIKIPEYPWRKFKTLCGKEYLAAGENEPVTCKSCLKSLEKKPTPSQTYWKRERP